MKHTFKLCFRCGSVIPEGECRCTKCNVFVPIVPPLSIAKIERQMRERPEKLQ